MRYLGKKSRLLAQIEECAHTLGFEGGTVCDLFAGSGVVGRYFRERGHRVVSTDVMASSYVFQRLFLEHASFPAFARLAQNVPLPAEPAPAERIAPETTLPGDPRPLLRVIRWLEEGIPPVASILARQYSPAGRAKRGYFRPESAERLDAMLLALRDWRAQRWIDPGEQVFLLAAIIDAADRVANISGTYGAYLKTWQTNTANPIELRVQRLVGGPVGHAHRSDAFEWIAGVEADLLYIDPPYNHRQYPANYHLLDVIARIPEEADLEAFEASIYGKTGLVPWRTLASPLCSGRSGECREAFRALLARTTIPRLVLSYNEEGIMSRDDIEDVLAEYAGVARRKQPRKSWLREVAFDRFRSDADGRVATNGAGRRYRTVPGRERDVVHEWLFFVGRRAARKTVVS